MARASRHARQVVYPKVATSMPTTTAAPPSGPHAPPVSHAGPRDSSRYPGAGRSTPLSGAWNATACTRLIVRCAAHAAAWLAQVLPPAAASVDRLAELPSRLATVFTFDAAAVLAHDALRAELGTPAARGVVEALASVLATAGRLESREAFRAVAGQVKTETGQKGSALFHPIRIVLTGRSDGPELDVIVPAIDTGTALAASEGLAPIVGCRERAAALQAALARS